MKKIILTLLVLLCFLYAAAFTKNVILFNLYVSVAAFFVLFLFYYLLFRFILNASDPAIEKKYRSRRKLFIISATTCFLFFVNIGSLVERYFHVPVIKYAGFLAVFFLSLILGKGLLAPNRKKIIKLAFWAAGSLLCILLLIAGNIYFTSRIKISSTERILSLPYLAWVPAGDTIQYVGIIKYDKDRAYKGINIYCTGDPEVAYLIDMQGEILHTWFIETSGKKGFNHVQMDRNGDLLAIVDDNQYLMRLDWDGKIKWSKKERAHHDIAIADNGDIYYLTRKIELIWNFGLPLPIGNDYIALCSAEGDIKKETSIYNIFKKQVSFSKYLEAYSVMAKPRTFLEIIKVILRRKGRNKLEKKCAFDFFHANSISIIDRDIAGLCKKSDLLLSFRNINLIAIIGAVDNKIKWEWGKGELIMQHHPTLLENNHILVFDNGHRYARPYSRVIELDPITKKIVWEYKSNPPEEFFSETRGAAQRLPNGNTLITDSDSGRVFEVTKSKEIVWEFYNPELEKEQKKRAGIYRFIRIVDQKRYLKLSTLK